MRIHLLTKFSMGGVLRTIVKVAEGRIYDEEQDEFNEEEFKVEATVGDNLCNDGVGEINFDEVGDDGDDDDGDAADSFVVVVVVAAAAAAVAVVIDDDDEVVVVVEDFALDDFHFVEDCQCT